MKNIRKTVLLSVLLLIMLIACSDPAFQTNGTSGCDVLDRAVETEAAPETFSFGQFMVGFREMADHNWKTLDSFGVPDITNDQGKIVIADIQSTNGADTCAIRFDNDYDNGNIRGHLRVSIQEEQSDDDETAHADEVIGGLLVDSGTLYDVNGRIIGEAHYRLDIDQVDGEVNSIAAGANMHNPVVFANIRTNDGTQPCHLRITGKERSGQGWIFSFIIEEWEYLDGDHTGERIDILLLEEGIHLIGYSHDGDHPAYLEVGKFTPEGSNLGWHTVKLASDFDNNPIVVTQTQTIAGWHQEITRNRNINAANHSFQVRIYEEEGRSENGDNSHLPEEIGYFAVGYGHRKYKIDAARYVNLMTGGHNSCVNRVICNSADVWGTDLGIPFYNSADDRIYYVFGDTFDGNSSGAYRDQRSPVMARSAQVAYNLNNVRAGYLSNWLAGNTYADPLWPKPIENYTYTDIPTAAWYMNGYMYIYTMRVVDWPRPSEWNTIFSRLMYSGSGGAPGTWYEACRTADGDEIMSMAFVWPDETDYVYFYVSYPGRLGKDPNPGHPVYVMRVARNLFPDFTIETDGQYLNGQFPNAEWVSGKENWTDPTIVMQGNIGELSVKKFVSIDNYYLAMYYDFLAADQKKFIMAQSETPYGPWTEIGEIDLSQITNSPYGGGLVNTYGGYMIGQISAQNPGSVDVYFTLSEWGVGDPLGDRYNVHMLKVLVHE